MKDHLRRWWATHATWLGALASFLEPSVQAWIAGHPGKSVLIGAIWGMILHQLQSPTVKDRPSAGAFGRQADL